ncbi:somatotropin isoform X2 [Nelusetta ayraudi]|uniref:somatotropin isoform X2 n=1 Tax=Nelusetta ayraudi TaxID=303726 RepID=UPI003F7144F0
MLVAVLVVALVATHITTLVAVPVAALVAVLVVMLIAVLIVMLVAVLVAMLVPVCEVVLLLLLRAQQEISLQAEEQTEEQQQHNKIFLQDSDCKSDYIISPNHKHETQRSSVLKLLEVSYHLLDSWELPSRSLPGALRTQISEKLSQLKAGIRLLFKANQGAAEVLTEGSAPLLDDYRNFYRSAESLACFKKDMHKVETYLTVGKCRLSPEANCTL